MVELKAKLITDAWVPASWEDYLQTIADPTYEKLKATTIKGT